MRPVNAEARGLLAVTIDVEDGAIVDSTTTRKGEIVGFQSIRMCDPQQSVSGDKDVVVVEVLHEHSRRKRIVEIDVISLASGLDDLAPPTLAVPISFRQVLDDGDDERVFSMGEAIVGVYAEGLEILPPLTLSLDDLAHDADGGVFGSDDEFLEFEGDWNKKEYLFRIVFYNTLDRLVADMAEVNGDRQCAKTQFEFSLLVRDRSKVGAVDADGCGAQGQTRYGDFDCSTENWGLITGGREREDEECEKGQTHRIL